jgi:hypothetical protein
MYISEKWFVSANESALRAHSPQLAAGNASKMETVLLYLLALRRFPAGCCRELQLIRRSDILVIGAPHREYKILDCSQKSVVDIWNSLGKGGRLL